jgi:(E)-4-hydroxy-3-methyl-but-2-enyl pyrophosphate reductase
MGRRGFEILLADTAGFCMGVQRAVQMVLDAAQDPATVLPIRTPGPLIHNRQVIELLERRGVLAVDDPAEGGTGTAVVRAHGLSRQEGDRLARAAGTLLDATCPHVRRAQNLAEQYSAQGYLCVVVGDRGHAEVEGVLSYAGGAGHVVSGPDDVNSLPPAERVAVIAQTTQDEEVFRATVRRIRERHAECLVFETICRSTAMRQAEVRDLAPKVDAMVIVGDRNSANSRRLAEISAGTGTPTHYVETEDDLDVDRLLRCGRVGLTAGASTPNWMIRRVILRLEDEYRRRSRPGLHAMRQVLRAFVYVNACAAGAAAALTFASAYLLPSVPGALALCMGVSFSFVLSQHLLNQYVRRESLYMSEPLRADYFLAAERVLLWLGIGGSALSLALSALLGAWAFAVVASGSALGLLYRLRWPRPLAERLLLNSLEQLPASKEVSVGLAWASMGALLPALTARSPLGPSVITFVVCGLMGFQRTLALDLRDVQADQLVGRETLVRLIGPPAAFRLLLVIALAEAVLLVGTGLAGHLSSVGPWCALAAAYGAFSSAALRHGGVHEDAAEVLVDGQFYLMAALCLLWRLL